MSVWAPRLLVAALVKRRDLGCTLEDGSGIECAARLILALEVSFDLAEPAINRNQQDNGHEQ